MDWRKSAERPDPVVAGTRKTVLLVAASHCAVSKWLKRPSDGSRSKRRVSAKEQVKLHEHYCLVLYPFQCMCSRTITTRAAAEYAVSVPLTRAVKKRHRRTKKNARLYCDTVVRWQMHYRFHTLICGRL